MIITIHFMNIRNFDLNLLIVFKTLFDERNVTRASKKIGITQPAMSNALNRLRYLVNDELFIRGPKGMRPTPRATELSIPVKDALSNLEFALSTINFNPATAEKLYRISISDDVAPLIVPNLVSFLQKKYKFENFNSDDMYFDQHKDIIDNKFANVCKYEEGLNVMKIIQKIRNYN